MAEIDSFVQVAADGVGKKVATQETARNDGTIVEQQEVMISDPATGRPQPVPPWGDILLHLRMLIVEVRVLSMLKAEETRELTGNTLDDLRLEIERDMQ